MIKKIAKNGKVFGILALVLLIIIMTYQMKTEQINLGEVEDQKTY